MQKRISRAPSTIYHLPSTNHGFTIIELLVVIVIIGILSTITFVTYNGIQAKARDTAVLADIDTMDALQTNYGLKHNGVGKAYFSADGYDVDLGFKPTVGNIINVYVNSTDYCIKGYNPGGTKKTNTNAFIKETSTGVCALLSADGNVLTLIAGTGGTVSGGGAYDPADTPTITATANPTYTFLNWTGDTGCSGAISHTITMEASKSCTANFTANVITAPSAPTVTANTPDTTTTWSWGSASCPGNSVRYQYDYTYTPIGYDSGWVATASTSVPFTTSAEGQTYTVAVQAQCYNGGNSSAWSAADEDSYYRAITTYTLTINSAGNGTVNAGGTYNLNDTPTITATPSTYYSFSSWTGSTGCSGVASHTITMDAAKSCTANFTPTAISAPAAPTVSANTVGATTTWSWGAASCPGNTARYQYRYTYTPAGYDSGLVATASTSVGFTTSTEGQTYVVAVQAECYNAVTASGMSTAGSDSYYRATTNYTLTINAGANGTVNSGGSYAPGSTPIITATPNANYQFSSWTGDTGCSGVASHTITMDANKSCTANFTIITYTLTIAAGAGGTVNAGGTYNSGTTQTITATPSTYYSFSSWSGSTGCSGVASHTITMDAAKSCTANFTVTPISAPSAPTVTANTVGATTTWSWGAASCPGNSVQYQYHYTISPSGYDSGYGATVPTSIGFTTSTEGQTYTVAIQARCYNTATTSSWSGSGSASYLRPITYYTLTTVAGSGGTVSAGGSYAIGSTPTITATPRTYSSFNSWSGSTGCSGVASHTITMDAAKSCTANFTLGANWLAIGTQVWAKANLNVGTMVTGATTQRDNAILEKYCYSNTESNCTTYGGLYQWDEAMQYVTTNGAQGICPTDSHFPTDSQWTTLTTYLGGSATAGTELKSGGSSGLNMPLAGYRFTDGTFALRLSNGYLWSSTQSSIYAWKLTLDSSLASVTRVASNKLYGVSVRCMGN